MRGWLRRLRGLLGMSTVGAVTGGLFGIVAWILDGLGPVGLFNFSMTFFATVYGSIGAATGMSFGLLLTGTSRTRRLEEVSHRRVAVLGALAGGAVPLLISSLAVGAVPTLGTALVMVAVGGGMGAGIGAGLLTVAKRADRAGSLGTAQKGPLLE